MTNNLNGRIELGKTKWQHLGHLRAHSSVVRSRINQLWSPLVLLVSAIVWATINLSTYPPPWFDEGLNFQVPKNLLLHSTYALRSSEGFRIFDPAIQTGPTVLLPATLSFWLLGIGLIQARAVVVVYMVLALVAFYGLARHTYNGRAAIAAVLLLIFLPGEESTSFLLYGRQFLGEVPALFFLLIGTWLWLRGWELVRDNYLIGAGFCYGLAMLTKSQYMVVLPLASGLFWMTDTVWYKKLRPRHLVLPGFVAVSIIGLWYLCQILIVGPETYTANAAVLREGFRIHIASLSLSHLRRGLGTLVRTRYVLWGLPAILYGLLQNLPWRQHSVRARVLLAFIVTWLGWYTVLSIGWSRYAFAPLAISHIFVAKLLYDLSDGFRFSSKQLTQKASKLISGLVAFGLIISLAWTGFWPLARDILFSRDRGFLGFTAYLNDNVNTADVIESFEWELDLVADHNFHHPPTSVTNVVTAEIWYGIPPPPQFYDFLVGNPTFIVNGIFSKWTGVYPSDFLQEKCQLVASFGDYDLYRVKARR